MTITEKNGIHEPITNIGPLCPWRANVEIIYAATNKKVTGIIALARSSSFDTTEPKAENINIYKNNPNIKYIIYIPNNEKFIIIFNALNNPAGYIDEKIIKEAANDAIIIANCATDDKVIANTLPTISSFGSAVVISNYIVRLSFSLATAVATV